jgi:hypothetical protein
MDGTSLIHIEFEILLIHDLLELSVLVSYNTVNI